MTRAILTVLVVLAALPASAQQLTLQIQDGLVSMTATSVPVREVLAAWARVGRHSRGRRRTDRRTAAHPDAREGARGQGARHHPAGRRRLRGGGARRAGHRVVELRPHPGAGHQFAAGSHARGRAPGCADDDATRAGGAEVDTPDTTADAVRRLGDARSGTEPVRCGVRAARNEPAVRAPGQPVPFGQPGQPVPFGQPTPFGQPLPFGQQPGAAPFGVPMAQPNGNRALPAGAAAAASAARRRRGSSARSARRSGDACSSRCSPAAAACSRARAALSRSVWHVDSLPARPAADGEHGRPGSLSRG